jgi:hypothetical protein
MPELFYLNALFDLELGGHSVERVRAGALEMGTLFAFCGTKDDRILLDVKVPGDYWKYLDSCALPYAPMLGDNDNPTHFSGVAWGWNRQIVERLSALGVRRRHPDLQVVKKINNRSFCAAFNNSTQTGVPGTRFCSTLDEVHKAVHDLNNRFPLVAKPAFGGSGSGFITMSGPGDNADGLEKLVKRHGCIIEPWCDRVVDVSSSCVISESGTIADLRRYRCFTSNRGAFIGVTFPGEIDPVIEKYRFELDCAVNMAIDALVKAGYFGPVSFDSFVYRDPSSGEERLAAIIEINGRHGMSSIAHALYASIGDERTCYFRFLGRKMCALPATYDECRQRIGEHWYDPVKRKGVVLLTPLRVAHGKLWVQPVRSAFFIVGSDMDEVRAMDDGLRTAFGNSNR